MALAAVWAVARRFLGAVPWQVWAAVALWAVFAFMHHQVRTARADSVKARAAQAAAENTLQKALDDARDREVARLRHITQQHKEAADAARETITLARRDADAARGAADGLRQQARALRRRVADAQPADRGQAADAAIGVLADVLGRCEGQLRDVAAFADLAHAAGATCQRSYDALIAPVTASP